MALDALHLPYPAHLRAAARRGALISLALQLAIYLTVLTPTAGFTVPVCALLVWLDGRLAREHLFHADLGAWPLWLAAAGAAGACAAEVATRLLLPLLGARGVLLG